MPITKRTFPPYRKAFTNTTSVTVNHKLGYKPKVQILDSNDKLMSGLPDHADNNSFTVTFVNPKTGTILY